MFRAIFLLFFILNAVNTTAQPKQTKFNIDTAITDWHKAAAEADFKNYIKLMTDDIVFIGTDPTEYWKGQDFLDFAKPYFDKGKAWTFYTKKRNIYISENSKTAWFDEILDTQMGICRGSGVLVFQNNKWLIKHYVLSISIPNKNVVKIKEMNSDFNQSFLDSLKRESAN